MELEPNNSEFIVLLRAMIARFLIVVVTPLRLHGHARYTDDLECGGNR